MKYLILIRHGSLDASLDGRYIGSTEALLSEHGIKESAALGQVLDASAQKVIYASPRIRVSQTIEAAGVNQTGIKWDERLREISFGECEQMTYEEIVEKHPGLAKYWRYDNPLFLFPGGEKVGDFRNRVSEFAEEISKLDDEIITVFTHGGVINILLEIFLDIPSDQVWKFAPSRGSISVLRLQRGGDASLPLLNFRPYLSSKGTMPWQ